MLVHRIEHSETGQGPYMRWEGFYGEDEWVNQSHYQESHPVPYEDRLRVGSGRVSDHMFDLMMPAVHGTDTLAKVREWFDEEEREALRELGFVLVTYDVPPHGYVRGMRQTVFSLPLATRVKERCPTEA